MQDKEIHGKKNWNIKVMVQIPPLHLDHLQKNDEQMVYLSSILTNIYT